MWKSFNFECGSCGVVFDDLVQGDDGKPEHCVGCEKSGPFIKLISCPAIPSVTVVSYPGSKRFKAGYVHTHGDRPAEKKDSQVSMYGAWKNKK